MLYEVITINRYEDGYYENKTFDRFNVDRSAFGRGVLFVITSYSIHYTKLYERPDRASGNGSDGGRPRDADRIEPGSGRRSGSRRYGDVFGIGWAFYRDHRSRKARGF